MKFTPTARLEVDLTQPVEEIKECILALMNTRPGQQIQILKEIDIFIGETLVALEKAAEQQKSGTTESAAEPNTKEDTLKS